MKISEYIEKLEALKNQFGDLPVFSLNGEQCCLYVTKQDDFSLNRVKCLKIKEISYDEETEYKSETTVYRYVLYKYENSLYTEEEIEQGKQSALDFSNYFSSEIELLDEFDVILV